MTTQPDGNTVEISHTRAPTLSDINTLTSRSSDYYAAFHAQCSLEEDYYFLRRPVPTRPGHNPVRPATARAIIDVATDHVDVDNLAIDIPLMRRSKARAERLRKFYLAAWDNIKRPVKRTSVKHQNAYGISFKKVMFDPDMWPDAPSPEDFGMVRPDGSTEVLLEDQYKAALKDFYDKRKILFPIRVENANPKELMWDDSRTGMKWTIRSVDMPAESVTERYPEWQTHKSDNAPVSWTEYWDDTWYAYLADNEFIHGPSRHGYGFNPFVAAFPAHSIDWDAGKPEERYKGILSPVHGLLDIEAVIMSQIQSILHVSAWGGLDFQGNSRAAAERDAEEYQMGDVNVLSPGTEVGPSPSPIIPQGLLEQLGEVQNMIEVATFPNVVRGMRPKGVSAGFGLSVLSGQGRLRFQGVADGEARSIEEVNTRFGMLVENRIQGPLTVHGRSEIHDFDETIRPDDIKGYYENVVTLKAEAPEERERESLLAMRLQAAGIISQFEAMRRSGIANPLEEQEQIAMEEVLAQLRPAQVEELQKRLAGTAIEQQQQAARDIPQPGPAGTQFLPGQQQLQRPGETGIQQAANASRAGTPSVYPQGISGLDMLGSQLGMPGGGAVGQPSGGVVPRA